MIDIYNQIWRNTYGSGIPTIIDIALSNACDKRFTRNEIKLIQDSLQIEIADQLESIIHIHNYNFTT